MPEAERLSLPRANPCFHLLPLKCWALWTAHWPGAKCHSLGAAGRFRVMALKNSLESLRLFSLGYRETPRIFRDKLVASKKKKKNLSNFLLKKQHWISEKCTVASYQREMLSCWCTLQNDSKPRSKSVIVVDTLRRWRREKHSLIFCHVDLLVQAL